MKTKLCLLAMPLVFVACGNKGQNVAKTQATDSVTTDSTVYAGEIPAADGPAISYELAIANDSTHGYRMTNTYTVGKEGEKKTFQNNGKMEVVEKDVDGKKAEFYKLKATDGAGDIIFKKVDDNTLRMVDVNFKEAESKLNYDLKKK